MIQDDDARIAEMVKSALDKELGRKNNRYWLRLYAGLAMHGLVTKNDEWWVNSRESAIEAFNIADVMVTEAERREKEAHDEA